MNRIKVLALIFSLVPSVVLLGYNTSLELYMALISFMGILASFGFINSKFDEFLNGFIPVSLGLLLASHIIIVLSSTILVIQVLSLICSLLSFIALLLYYA